MRVAHVEEPEERSRICREILSELRGWFGLPESNARCFILVKHLSCR